MNKEKKTFEERKSENALMYLPRSSSFQFIEPKNFIFLSEGALGVQNKKHKKRRARIPSISTARLKNSVVNY